MPNHNRLISSGTPAERVALACLIERGLQVMGAMEDHAYCVGGSPVLDFSYPHCMLFATALGYAIMGLIEDPLEILEKYNTSLATIPDVPEEEQQVQFPVILAAADILGLPYELLWEAQGLHHFGDTAKGIAAELRN